MKLEYAKLTGYIGIYKGSKGRFKTIEIDFTKCIHNIILIVGKNGCGKSTLLDALSPLVDPLGIFMEKHDGDKLLSYYDKDMNKRYVVNIKYPINKNGDRGQTKAYFKEIDLDTMTEIELNPNGNIGSYNEVLFDKMMLDPNFISLTALSGENKGLVDKTPAERKKYVNGILSTVEAYNAIGKALTKRSSTYKSLINTINAKITSIGDRVHLQEVLNSLYARSQQLEIRRKELEKKLAFHESSIAILDPNGSIQSKYSDIQASISNIDLSISRKQSQINSLTSRIEDFSIANAQQLSRVLVHKIATLESELTQYKMKISTLLADREEDVKILQLKTEKMNALTADMNYVDLKNEIRRIKSTLKEYENILNGIGIVDIVSISKDEYITALNTMKDIKDIIFTFRSNYTEGIVDKSASYALSSIDSLISELNSLKEEMDSLATTFVKAETNYNMLSMDIARLSVLDMRPKQCKIDTCGLISDILDLQKSNPQKRQLELKDIISNTLNRQSIIKDRIEELESILECTGQLKQIVRLVKSNEKILSKMPNGNMFIDINVFMSMIVAGATFNEISDLYSCIEYANLFEEYKNMKDLLYRYETDYKIYESKNEIINELITSIDEINQKITVVSDDIISINDSILSANTELDKAKTDLESIYNIISISDELKEMESNKTKLLSEFADIRDNIANIQNAVSSINETKSQLVIIDQDLAPFKANIDKTVFDLRTLDNYYIELDEFNKKYSLVEILKKHSAPSTGIQVVFMKLYMDTTTSMANSILSMMFDGELELLPYIINESEFRIPCRNKLSLMSNDDISSCSTGERCMIGLALSASLIKQSSSKYNILKLDEINGGLDYNNQNGFMKLLQEFPEKTNIEQVIGITHSLEAELSNVDIIRLVDPSNIHEELAGNVIFSY